MTDTIDPANDTRRARDSAALLVPADVGPGDRAAADRGAHLVESSFSRDLLASLLRFKDGDFGSRMATDFTGLDGKIADVFNEILGVSARRAAEIARVCRVVGNEG